jgi:aminopeptidase-like protein
MFVLENNRTTINQNPKCEPQLGTRNLYNSGKGDELAMLWVLNLSDGQHTLLDIAEQAGMDFREIHNAANMLSEKDLLKELPA